MTDPNRAYSDLYNAINKVALDHMISISDLRIERVFATSNDCTKVDFAVDIYDNHPSRSEKEMIEMDIKLALTDVLYNKVSFDTFVNNLVIKYVPYRFR